MSNHGGGRKISVEWNDVISLENDTKVLCKYCKEKISRKIERIKSHLKKCKAKVEQNKICDPDEECCIDLNLSMINEHVSPDFDVDNHNTENPKRRKIQSSMSSFIVKTTKEEQNCIDNKIALFFYSANVPFSVVESPQFIDMISSLRPGYVPPDRKKLSGTLLDKASEEIEQKMKADMDEATITLIQDGWSSVRNDPIIGTSLHTGKKAYLLQIIDAGSKQKTAEYCAEIALAAIKECKVKFGKDVFAICTDNEAKMKKMKEILKEHHPHLLSFGCSAHFLNLIAKEISPTVLLSQIVEVQKYFRNIHQPHGWLKEHGCLMPQIPNSTRWNSYKDCISTFLSNYHKYVHIASQHEHEFDVRISKILDNVVIYKEALNLQKQLLVISTSLNKLQSDTTTISHAVEIWKDLIESEELKPYRKIIENRYNQIMGPENFLANMMDARFNGRRLTADEEAKAEQWILENHAEWLPTVMAFKIRDEGLFPKSLFLESVLSKFSAAKWWKILKVKTENNLNSEFCTFFEALHSVTASSASIERIFSTFGFVWSKLRNKLGSERCEKLVKIYKYYHQKEQDW